MIKNQTLDYSIISVDEMNDLIDGKIIGYVGRDMLSIPLYGCLKSGNIEAAEVILKRGIFYKEQVKNLRKWFDGSPHIDLIDRCKVV